MEVLQTCRDPEIEDKILDAVNSPATHDAVRPLLRKFLEEHKAPPHVSDDVWTRRSRALEMNRLYLSAAELFERGEQEKAVDALDKILEAEPDYPFAVMLKELAQK